MILPVRIQLSTLLRYSRPRESVRKKKLKPETIQFLWAQSTTLKPVDFAPTSEGRRG